MTTRKSPEKRERREEPIRVTVREEERRGGTVSIRNIEQKGMFHFFALLCVSI